jgi:hypothetical protein
MNENEKQFSFTRAASSTSGRAKSKSVIRMFGAPQVNYKKLARMG